MQTQRVYARCQRTNRTRTLRRPLLTRRRMDEIREIVETSQIREALPHAHEYLTDLVAWWDAVED